MKRNTVHSDEHFKSKRSKNGEGNIQGQYFLKRQERKDGFCCKYSTIFSIMGTSSIPADALAGGPMSLLPGIRKHKL